jgi:predicted nucleic acid-binding protein
LIFVDTSAIYALADRGDSRHKAARATFGHILKSGEPLLTHNYVLVESLALIQHRLGINAAIQFAESASSFEIFWVDAETHNRAIDRLKGSKRQHLSLVDHVSFVFMSSRGIKRAFAYDRDFEVEGFRLLVSG